jgi:phosphatidylserine decarboxylase
MTPHQYIERETHDIHTEQLYWDRVIHFLYSKVRENSPALFKMLTGARMSSMLGFLNYEAFLGGRLSGNKSFLNQCGIRLDECLDTPHALNTPKKIFERKIRYWECRPMPTEQNAVLSPADARVLIGSFCETDSLFIKEKFFGYEQLIGTDKPAWIDAFRGGDFAIFRLTPDKYHYNHTPVAGRIVDFYEIPGQYHSCNPNAVITTITPYSLNKRVLTIVDTDVSKGTHVGLVAMIEVVAFMIGEIVQRYSEDRYENPLTVTPGMFIRKGCPKSLYRPGSSTDVLIFQKNRVRFAEDIVRNLGDGRASSRFTKGFGEPLVETDVKVRSLIAKSLS